MISFDEPTNCPPIKIAGTEGWQPSLCSARSMSRPLASRSSSWIAGLAPSSRNSASMLWHMQHELLVKITAAFFDAKSLTLSIFESVDVQKQRNFTNAMHGEQRNFTKANNVVCTQIKPKAKESTRKSGRPDPFSGEIRWPAVVEMVG
ncbi:hypothetical protein HYC85_024797 [Camellia sinensis]|uniref:Uncharacterized protein n=1 Tax=Camellia sinensis TaxID=4442 RepID=A0A7J7GBJ0_CAMSI|nr:hypothetical protein HYC85_024797 [Camellia sinensis]